jgi:hypothetical protein
MATTCRCERCTDVEGYGMSKVSKIDRMLIRLHRAGWSVGETAFGEGESITWLVYGTQGGYELRAESLRRVEAWGEAYRQAKELGLIEPL